ncbi:MAG: hypothetical protein ACI9LV_000962 [Candidatus Nanohaloarchaea archaeon]|jgi:hypothetical protein
MGKDWSRRFQDLEEYQKEALSNNWKDIYRSIQETDRDWARMTDLRSEIDEKSNRGFSTAYTAFMEVYDPPSSGSAIGIYLLETDEEGDYTELDRFSEEFGFETPADKKDFSIDDALENT